jgi:hypothetical protein
MRGINKGQRVHIYVIPEVKDLMIRELNNGASIKTSGFESKPITDYLKWDSRSPADCKIVLIAINAWLIINSIRSERVQFNQLCIQNVANVWRKNAYSQLLIRHHEITSANSYHDVERELRECLETFCEPIDFSLLENMTDPIHFSDSIRDRMTGFKNLIKTAQESQIIDDILSMISLQRSSDIIPVEGGHVAKHREEGDMRFDSEMVQEQEQEKEVGFCRLFYFVHCSSCFYFASHRHKITYYHILGGTRERTRARNRNREIC